MLQLNPANEDIIRSWQGMGEAPVLSMYSLVIDLSRVYHGND